MAFIHKAAGGVVTYRSELARAGPDSMAAFQRQRDTLKLALAGSRDCRRLWADFASECPEDARLVALDVESERRKGAAVSRGLDRRLAAAELVVTKSLKSKKPKKVTKSAKRRPLDDPELDGVLSIADPVRREAAYQDLMGRRV